MAGVFEGESSGPLPRSGESSVAGYGIAWELSEDGHLRRVLPATVQSQIEAAIQELRQPRFEAAFRLFEAARDGYDDRPRRNRDACANVFASMESVAKIVFSMPNDTFGSVLGHIRSSGEIKSEIVSVLDAINTVRNRKFGHGMPTTFDLSGPEVDFTYLSCIGGILLSPDYDGYHQNPLRKEQNDRVPDDFNLGDFG
jgi:hypothetical protein